MLADGAATVVQRVVSAAAAVALLLAPSAHAFGPVSVKLEDIVVSRVDCAGMNAYVARDVVISMQQAGTAVHVS